MERLRRCVSIADRRARARAHTHTHTHTTHAATGVVVDRRIGAVGFVGHVDRRVDCCVPHTCICGELIDQLGRVGAEGRSALAVTSFQRGRS